MVARREGEGGIGRRWCRELEVGAENGGRAGAVGVVAVEEGMDLVESPV